MKRFYIIIQIVSSMFFFSCISQEVSAGGPLWTVTPVLGYPPSVTVYLGESVVVKYIVTNQSRKIHHLKMKPIKGIRASGCSSGLRYRQRCVLSLVVNGNALVGNTVGGPVICDSRSLTQCYRPSLRDMLKIRLIKSPKTYKAIPSVGAHGSISPARASVVKSGAKIVFTAKPNTGYGVSKWFLDKKLVQTGGNTYRLTNMKANHIVSVTFERKFTVTPSADANGSVSPNSAQGVSSGAYLVFTATPENGYDVDKWFVDNNLVQTGGTTYHLNNIKSNRAVNVTFAPTLFTVIPSTGANGLIGPATEQAVSSGANLLFTATPDNGYAINEWFVDNNLVQTGGATYQLNNITANHTVNVTFQPALIVIPSAGANGLISPATDQSLNSGGNITFTATPDSGYGVKEWFVDNNLVQTGGTTYQLTNITANHTVNVTFDTASLTATTAIIPVGGGTGTITITNTGPTQITNASVDLPPDWTEVTPTANNCATVAPNGGTCTISFSATKPHAVSGSLPIISDQILNPQPVTALAFSINGFLVFSVDSAHSTASVINKLPIAPNPFWGPQLVLNATSLSDGQLNTSAIITGSSANNPPWPFPCGGSPCGAAVNCNNSTAGGASTGTWYLPAICQLTPRGTVISDSTQNPPPQCDSDNISDLAKYRFFTAYGTYHSSTEQLDGGQRTANNVAIISSNAPYIISVGLVFKNDRRLVLCARSITY